MNTLCRWQLVTAAGLGLFLAVTTGCQTWIPQAGLTLPSGHYLEHHPQYIPPSQPFPLPRELASQEATWTQPAGPPQAGVLPAPVPNVPGPPPMPGPRGL
jgi:hypothetical protein